MAHRKKSHQKQQFIIGYCRKSTDTEDKQVRSLEDQKKLIQEYHRGLPDEESYPLKIMEEAKSAYHPGREVYNEIMAMADNGEVHAVLVLDPTRLSRNPEDAGKLVQRLADNTMHSVMTVAGKRYSRTDTSQLFMLMLESTMSWKDSADKGDRVSVAMKEKAKEGGTTGPAPIGYRNMGETKGSKWMEIDPETGPRVRRLFVMASTGAYSLNDLEGEAALMGIRTRPSRRHPEGNYLLRSTLHHMLTNPDYKGDKRYMGEVHKGAHEALVEPEIWDRVQIALSSRCTHSNRNKELTLRDYFIMAGCVRCGDCKQRAMSPYRAKQGRYIIYECKNPRTKCKNCINQDDLIEQLHESLEALYLTEDEKEYMRKTMQGVHESRMKEVIDERQSVELEYASIESQIAEVFLQREEAKRHGVLDAVDTKLAQLKMHRDELQQARQRLHDEGSDWIDHVIRCFELAKLVQEALKFGSPEIRQSILKALASNYYVSDKKLVVDWVSPFKEKVKSNDCTIWLPRLDSNQRPIG